MIQTELLLAIDNHGSFIALYGERIETQQSRFRLLLVEQIPVVMSVDDSQGLSRRDSGWLTSWSAAEEALSQYPWSLMECHYLDARVAVAVWEALNHYVDRTGNSPIPSAWGRWRRACGQQVRQADAGLGAPPT